MTPTSSSPATAPRASGETPSSPGRFTAVTRSLEVDVGGETIELRGFLKTEDVTGYAGLWMRQDGVGGVVQFDNMHNA